MTVPIYTLARTPGATETVEWQAICHVRTPYVLIRHEPTRELSRWKRAERKFPFCVHRCGRRIGFGSPVSNHRTYEAARKAAAKLAEEV